MVDHVNILKQGPQLGAVIDIPARKVNIAYEGLGIASGQIIESAHLMSLVGEVIGKGRAEESRGSCD
jgi:hypothetical protein